MFGMCGDVLGGRERWSDYKFVLSIHQCSGVS